MPLGQGYTVEGQITGKEVGNTSLTIVHALYLVGVNITGRRRASG
jgi:hypothetical protein